MDNQVRLQYLKVVKSLISGYFAVIRNGKYLLLIIALLGNNC